MNGRVTDFLEALSGWLVRASLNTAGNIYESFLDEGNTSCGFSSVFEIVLLALTKRPPLMLYQSMTINVALLLPCLRH